MKSGDPLVCVCIPAYNAEATLAETLGSVIGQSHKNLRILIVDNASTDKTLEVAQAYAEKDGRIEISRHPENIGGEGNFTRCIQLAAGDYTAIYHADDVYSEAMIEEEVAFLEANREAGAVFTAALEIDKNGTVIGRRAVPKFLTASGKTVYPFEDILKAVLKTGNFMIFPSAMVRTCIYKDEIKAWNGEKYRTSADLDVWLRIAERHGIGLLPAPLIKYRLSSNSFSYSYARLRTQRHDMFLVLEDHVKKHAGGIVGEREQDDYELLLLKDDINIAINHVIRGERGMACARLKDIFSFKNIKNSFRSCIQFRILLIGYAAFALSILPLWPGARALLSGIRHKG